MLSVEEARSSRVVWRLSRFEAEPGEDGFIGVLVHRAWFIGLGSSRTGSSDWFVGLLSSGTGSSEHVHRAWFVENSYVGTVRSKFVMRWKFICFSFGA